LIGTEFTLLKFYFHLFQTHQQNVKCDRIIRTTKRLINFPTQITNQLIRVKNHWCIYSKYDI